MPSVSASQAKLMSAIAHGWRPAGAKNLPPLAVAKEFHEADKKKGEFMHYKADGGTVLHPKQSLADAVARQAAIPSPGADPAAQAAYADQARIRVGDSMASYLQMRAILDSLNPVPSKADGGKVSAVVDFAKQGTKALMDRISGAFDNPYTANTDQLRSDVAKYWRTKTPPSEPTLQKIDTSELDDLINKPTKIQGLADGGSFLNSDPPRRVRTYNSARSDDTPSNTLGLIRHAADRVTAAVADDPHHMLARIASGLTSQLAGLSPSGKAEFGRVPGIVNETKALPAGLTDIGTGLASLSGAVADKLQDKGMSTTTGTALQAIRDGLDRLKDKYGDLAPDWSRKAEAASDKLHAAVHDQMGLSPPKGFAENAAEAGGMMLGQIPVGGEGDVEKGAAKLLAESPLEWLSPTVRPSLKNYGAGTLAGGTLGALGDQ